MCIKSSLNLLYVILVGGWWQLSVDTWEMNSINMLGYLCTVWSESCGVWNNCYGNNPVLLKDMCIRFHVRHLTEREIDIFFYLTMHSTHFIYGYMTSYIWLRTILIVRKETCCRHIGYSYRLTARVLLYAPYTDKITHTTTFVTPVMEHWLVREIAQWVHPMKDRSDDPSHHEQMLYLWATSSSRHLTECE